MLADLAERRNAIAQIHLVESDKLPEFSSEVLITMANGKEIQTKLSDLRHTDNDEY